jgi:Fe2+ or Zn2+ uptake regulation protein
MRTTAPRLAVHGAIAELGGHRSVDEVVAHLRETGTPLPRASVYNSVDALVRAGVVLAADAGPGRALYEAGEDFHHHFVCRRCGAVRDVACVVGVKPCLEPAFEGGVVEEAQVIFRGLCDTCAAASPNDGATRAAAPA